MIKQAEALDILRGRGYVAGTPNPHTGRVSIWLRRSEEAVEVEMGTELRELAEGRLTLEQVRDRREQETASIE